MESGGWGLRGEGKGEGSKIQDLFADSMTARFLPRSDALVSDDFIVHVVQVVHVESRSYDQWWQNETPRQHLSQTKMSMWLISFWCLPISWWRLKLIGLSKTLFGCLGFLRGFYWEVRDPPADWKGFWGFFQGFWACLRQDFWTDSWDPREITRWKPGTLTEEQTIKKNSIGLISSTEQLTLTDWENVEWETVPSAVKRITNPPKSSACVVSMTTIAFSFTVVQRGMYSHIIPID